MTDKAPGYDSQGVPTIGTRIQALEAERDQMRRQRDHYRDVLKGISKNIDAMLKPIGETEK